MIQEIADLERLKDCADSLRKKHFTAGFDNMDADSAALWLEINGSKLSQKLINGNYDIMPAVGFYKAKTNGQYRQIARLTAIDTVIQQSILSVAEDKCEKQFSCRSFAYRKNKGLSGALTLYCQEGSVHQFSIKLDPVACYDNIDHSILEKSIAGLLNEKAVIRLIMNFVRMPILIDKEFIYPEKGILQGAPLSGLLCNVYFDSLDKFLESQSIPFIRYADDIVMFADSLNDAKNRYQLAADFLTEQLRLKINKRKTAIDSPSEIQYLGHRFEKDKRGLIALNIHNSIPDAYYNWHEQRPHNTHGRVDILSDGILQQKDFSLAFDSVNQKTMLPIENVDIINIYSDVIFDSGFLKRAMKHGISINLFDTNDHLIGHFLPAAAIKSPRTTAEQLLSYNDMEKRLHLAKQILLASVHNTRIVIRYYQKNYPSDIYTKVLAEIQKLYKQIKICEEYNELLLTEARIREAYYSCFDSFLSVDGFCFDKRTRRPPKNEVNAMLSFGYTVLYNLIATEINKTSLDVRVGFLHATNRRMKSLNLDIAEIFKPLIVDRTVFSLVNLHIINLDDFRFEENGACYLTEDGKRIFLRYFYEKLDSTQKIKEEHFSYHQLIRNQIYALIRCFKGQEDFKPFKQVR